MRKVFAAVVTMLLCTGVAGAQTSDIGQGYVEVVAQSAFGNVTSQSYGVELGYTLDPSVQLFFEGGWTRDVATAALGNAAQLIAGALAQTQGGGVAYKVREPVTFGDAGVKYVFSTGGKLLPYTMAGIGIARVKNDVRFSVGGTDVTDTLDQYQIVLGSDLSGSFTKPLILLGAGAAYPVWRQLVLDFQFRYGRIFAPDHGINVSRAGIGIGYRF